MGAYRDTRPDSEVTHVSSQPYYSRRSKANTLYCCGGKANGAVQAAAKMVTADVSGYPVSAAIEPLWDVVLTAKDDNAALASLPSRFASETQSLIQRLSVLGDWQYVTAVTGLDLTAGALDLGRCHFAILDQNELGKLKNGFIVGKPPIASQLWNAMQGGIGGVNQLVGQPVVSIRVRAADSKHAEAVALQVIQESLNVCCYAQSAVIDFSYPFPEVGLQTTGKRRFGLCLRHDTPELPTNQQMSSPIGPPIVVTQNAPGWQALLNILQMTPGQRTELAGRILVAAQWCANAAFANSDAVRLVSIATALEAIFIIGDEGKRRNLRDRISWLLGSNSHDRQSIGNSVDEVYSYRSDCVHSGNNYVESNVLKNAMSLLSRSIGRLTTDPPFSSMLELQALVSWVDAQNGDDSSATH